MTCANSNHKRSHESSIAEIAHLLALAYMRKRIRSARQKIDQQAENSLDDVALSARVGTGEGQTSENRR